METNEIITNARRDIAGAITPKAVGLRPVKVYHLCLTSRRSDAGTKNAFNDVSGRFFSIHRLAAADALHWIEQGTYGRGFFPKLIKLIGTKNKVILKKINNK
jgi:hypothetical protein